MMLALTLVLVVALVGVGYGLLSRGPGSLRAEYLRDRAQGLARKVPAPLLTEADLSPLPAPVQRYLRVTGSVGQPRVHSFRLEFRGRLRADARSKWMTLRAYQHTFLDQPTRLFYLEASMSGVPALGYHRYQGGAASMRVKIAGLLTVVDGSGPAFTRAETVTLLNDMCVLAPATLIDPAIAWEAVDDRTARATFTCAGQTIHGVLHFGEGGELVDFDSDDRPALAPDGKTFLPMRWSTPLRDYRAFGPRRVSTRAEVMYDAPTGRYAYGEFELVDIAYNPD